MESHGEFCVGALHRKTTTKDRVVLPLDDRTNERPFGLQECLEGGDYNVWESWIDTIDGLGRNH